MMHFEQKGDGIYVDNVCAIYRWYTPLIRRPGTYRLIALNAAFDLMEFYNDNYSPEHPTCVVDDFGNLQKVPA